MRSGLLFGALIATVGACLSACATAGAGSPDSPNDQTIQIPINDPSGHAWLMQGRICRPDGVKQPQLVIINHGSPPSAADRPTMALAHCNNEAAQWFLRRHYAVVFALRLGYGATGGPWTEGEARCDDADYFAAGLETARQIDAIVNYAVTLPNVDPRDVIVIGQSAGGWGTLAYDSMPHPKVGAFVNMAGGRGGHYRQIANNNCHSERLVDAAARFGKTATTTMLWIYTGNDSYFAPSIARSIDDAFQQAGGRVLLYRPASYGKDGHKLFFGDNGSAIWGPLVASYLAQMKPAFAIPEAANHSK